MDPTPEPSDEDEESEEEEEEDDLFGGGKKDDDPAASKYNAEKIPIFFTCLSRKMIVSNNI